MFWCTDDERMEWLLNFNAYTLAAFAFRMDYSFGITCKLMLLLWFLAWHNHKTSINQMNQSEMSSLYKNASSLSLVVRSVRLGVSPLSWTDGSLSGTLWRLWCSCCRYRHTRCFPGITWHDCISLSGLWCYWCCFRMWFQPRCRWSAWWSQMNSGIRRSHTSASGRRKTVWASRWVFKLNCCKTKPASRLLYTLQRWEVSEIGPNCLFLSHMSFT